MTRTLATGQTCVGEVRLSPLDVGFDLRLHDMLAEIPDSFASVGLEQDGEVWLVTGTRDEMCAAIRAAGYTIAGE